MACSAGSNRSGARPIGALTTRPGGQAPPRRAPPPRPAPPARASPPPTGPQGRTLLSRQRDPLPGQHPPDPPRQRRQQRPQIRRTRMPGRGEAHRPVGIRGEHAVHHHGAEGFVVIADEQAVTHPNAQVGGRNAGMPGPHVSGDQRFRGVEHVARHQGGRHLPQDPRQICRHCVSPDCGPSPCAAPGRSRHQWPTRVSSSGSEIVGCIRCSRCRCTATPTAHRSNAVRTRATAASRERVSDMPPFYAAARSTPPHTTSAGTKPRASNQATCACTRSRRMSYSPFTSGHHVR